MSDTLNQLLSSGRSATFNAGDMTQFNPLAAVQAGNQAAQSVFKTRELQANQALGNILQQATDPNGNVDYQKAQSLAAGAGPVVQMGMQSYLQSNSVLRGQQLQNTMGTSALIASHAMTVAKDPSDGNVNAAFDDLAARGMPQEQIDRERQRWLAMSGPERQNEAFRAGLLHLDQLGRVMGLTTPTDIGGRTVPATTTQPSPGSPGGSLTVGAGGVDSGLTPAQRATEVEWTSSDGVHHKGTLEQMHRELGIPTPSGPAVGGAGGGGSGAAGGSGTTPPKSASIAGPQPGDEEKWKASALAYNADNADAGSYQQRIFPLVQAASILKSGNVTTGAGAEALNSVRSRLMTVASTLGVDAQTIQQADFDKLAKYMQQYVNQQGLSGRSDQAMASAVSGNPSAHISTLANEQILPVMIGMERMKQMMITDFTKSGGKPNQYSDYKTDWQNTHDPRAFIVDMMSPDQQKKMVASMTPSQKLAFSRTLDLIERNPGIMGQAAMPGH